VRLSIDQCFDLLLYYFILPKSLGMYCSTVTSCTVLLFIVYTVTVTYTIIVIVHHVYDYCWLLYCTFTVTVSSQYSR